MNFFELKRDVEGMLNGGKSFEQIAKSLKGWVVFFLDNEDMGLKKDDVYLWVHSGPYLKTVSVKG